MRQIFWNFRGLARGPAIRATRALSQVEKRGRPFHASASYDLSHLVDCHGLIYLGFTGGSFTWSNRRHEHHLIRKSLDRGVDNSKWRLLFPKVFIRHLPWGASDHSTLFLDMVGDARMGPKPFRFEAFRMQDARSLEVVRTAWNYHCVGFDPLKSRNFTPKSWAAICHPKDFGGMDLRLFYDVNIALVTKLSWSVYSSPTSPWVHSLKAKYTGEIICIWPRSKLRPLGCGKGFGWFGKLIAKGASHLAGPVGVIVAQFSTFA